LFELEIGGTESQKASQKTVFFDHNFYLGMGLEGPWKTMKGHRKESLYLEI
jgi:hypothetical protein